MAIQVDPTLPVARMSLELWHGMIEAGLLEESRVELIEGVMVEMSPKSPPHDGTVQALTRILVRAALEVELDVRVQSSMTIGESEPEPDLAVVQPGGESMRAHPATALLVVEVAVSSHRLDRGRKAELYAQAGVPEYWVVDVPGRAIELFTTPVDGRYGRTERRGPEATVVPAALPAATVVVGELLPGS